MRSVRTLGFVCLCLTAASLALAQFGGGRFRGRFRQELPPNTPYDGRFVFVRMNYESTPDGYWYGGEPAWAHGNPVAEKKLMGNKNEISFMGAHEESANSIRFDYPELFNYPIAYVIEPNWWAITEKESTAIRNYMLKGGFIIVDDFKLRENIGGRFCGGSNWRNYEYLRTQGQGGGGWPSFEEMMKQVMPNYRFFDMSPSNPAFHPFFEIEHIDHFPQAY